MHGKAQPVQSPQSKRAHSYRFLELPQVFAAVWSTSGGVGREDRVRAQVGGESGECDRVYVEEGAGYQGDVQILASSTWVTNSLSE